MANLTWRIGPINRCGWVRLRAETGLTRQARKGVSLFCLQQRVVSGLLSVPADHRRIYEVAAFVESIKLIWRSIKNDKQTAAGSGLVFWEYEKIWSRLSLWGIRVMEDQSRRLARSQFRVYLRLNSLLPAPAATSVYELFLTDSLTGNCLKENTQATFSWTADMIKANLHPIYCLLIIFYLN